MSDASRTPTSFSSIRSSIVLPPSLGLSLALALGLSLAAPSDPARAAPVDATFQFFRRSERDRTVPKEAPEGAQRVKLGHRWKAGRDWAWLLGEVAIPTEVDGAPSALQPIGLRISCASGGEVYLDGVLQSRFDNDKPALVLASEAAEPGRTFRLAIQAHSPIDKEEENVFSEAEWVLISKDRALLPVALRIDPALAAEPVPDCLVGLSQGGTMADYDDATALKLREGGFRWFRMDNVLTGCLKAAGRAEASGDSAGKSASFEYDFSDLDRRVDFIHKVGADAILAASYMPQPLDAVPDGERHSAPRDYGAWEELCYRAARHCLERGRRVPFWEVWNEPNTGWIKPGPEDTAGERFERLYSRALGKPASDRGTVRTFEAYLKLYAATARGVRRADPEARIGGPALASGPFENSERGHCMNGRGFALGLILWCDEEKLPLDFLSWHEYFHPSEVFVAEADAFQKLLDAAPNLKSTVRSLMVTEWNEAWWADPPQDNEIGAAWCANTVIRAFLPARIDRPCFFYAKQGDRTFRGDYALLLEGNLPKPQFHVMSMLNGLCGRWVPVRGDDGEVSCVAAWDEKSGRLAAVVVNFTDRYNLRRPCRLAVRLPGKAASVERRVDGQHSNVYHDPARSGLEVVREARWPAGEIVYEAILPPHSVSLVEFAVERP